MLWFRIRPVTIKIVRVERVKENYFAMPLLKNCFFLVLFGKGRLESRKGLGGGGRRGAAAGCDVKLRSTTANKKGSQGFQKRCGKLLNNPLWLYIDFVYKLRKYSV